MQVFHLTKLENLYGENGICSKGLIPFCGERSKRIGDTRQVVSFTSKYYTLPIWWLYLYPKTNPNELCVLSFYIDKKDCINHINKSEFYTYNSIPPEKISLVYFYDKKTMDEIPFVYLEKNGIKYYNSDIFPTKVEITMKKIPISELIKTKYKILKKDKKQSKQKFSKV